MDAKSAFFKNSESQQFDDCSAIVPLIIFDDRKDEYVFIGTAFYISNSGIVMTAKHNLFATNNKLFEKIYIIHFTSDGYIPRPIAKMIYSYEHDIAYLLPAEIVDEYNSVIYAPSLILTDTLPEFDEQLGMYGYPNSRIITSEEETFVNLKSEFFLGKCREYHSNGFSILKNPCYQTTILIKSGASGGPVFDKHGNVFALCSTAFELDDGGENISFVTPLSASFQMVLDDDNGNKFTVLELIEKKIIAFKKSVAI